jgi:hypothetical protein
MEFDLIQYSRGGKRKVRIARRAGRRAERQQHKEARQQEREEAQAAAIAERQEARATKRGRRAGSAHRGAGSPQTWIAEAIDATVVTGDIAVSLTEGAEVVVLNNSALKHIYRNRTALLTAIYSAVAGSSVKSLGAALGAGVALVPSGIALAADAFGGIFGAAATPGTLVAGWRAHLSASVTNNAYQLFQIDVGPIVGAAGLQTMPAPVLSLGVYMYTPAADIIVWSPQNGAGQFALSPGNMNAAVLNGATTPSNGIVCRLLNATSFATFEGINMRDIYPRFGACPPAHDYEGISDGVDEFDFGGSRYLPTNQRGGRPHRAFPALRDEEED